MPLYSAVLAGFPKADISQLTIDSRRKLKNFLDTLARYRRLADVVSVSELISALSGEGAFLPLLIAGVGGGTSGNRNARPANIRLLTFYAEQFTSAQGGGNPGLPAFLAYINELKKSGADVRQANVNAQASGCVKLMTIHASKGLEFPICFVARVNQDYFRKGGGAKSATLMKFHNEAGITADYFNETNLCRFKTLLSDYVKRLEREETAAEEMRKLYVAATRAECKLIFTGYTKGGKVVENSYLTAIMAAVDNGQMTVSNWRLSEGNVLNSAMQNEQLALDEGWQVRDAVENVRAVYPREILRTIPQKLTATQVGVVKHVSESGNDYDEPTLFPRNPSFYGVKRLSGKQRGDAYHKAMELIDFGAGGYYEQLYSQCIKSRFTPIEYRAVNHDDIAGFFASSLGRRAVKAAMSNRLVKEYPLYTVVELSQLGMSSELLSAGENSCFVQGIADMFFYEEDGEIVLVDYKTNRNTTAERLVNDYGGQLAVYKRAIEEMTGSKVKECWLYSFERGEIRL
jgi:ATP-dependent helicase/nuclease subunit A